MMTFTPGKPILVLLALATVSGAVIAMRRPTARADLTLWTFTGTPVDANHPSALSAFATGTGARVDEKIMSARALDTRMLSLQMGMGAGAEVPAAVEIEVGSIGKFFRPPVADVGFVPLNSYLQRDGLDKAFLHSRLDMWSKGGEVFGLPLDVHPVTLTYRKDLFDSAGADPSTAQTWPQLRRTCSAYNEYWERHGFPARRAIELNSSAADYLVVLLQQRHINLLDAQNHITLDDDRVAATVAFYASLVAGKGAVAGDASPGETLWAGDLDRGDIAMVFTPDWRAAQIHTLAPSLTGRLAMMPLPVFDDTDAPTGSWGGSMIGIPRAYPRPEEAWKLVKFIATHPAQEENGLIPPLPDRWMNPEYHRPDPFYCGQQSVNDLYVRLAGQLPPRYVTPFSTLAAVELSHVLGKAVSQLRGGDDANLQQNCRQWLAEAADDLRQRIEFGTFETH